MIEIARKIVVFSLCNLLFWAIVYLFVALGLIFHVRKINCFSEEKPVFWILDKGDIKDFKFLKHKRIATIIRMIFGVSLFIFIVTIFTIVIFSYK